MCILSVASTQVDRREERRPTQSGYETFDMKMVKQASSLDNPFGKITRNDLLSRRMRACCYYGLQTKKEIILRSGEASCVLSNDVMLLANGVWHFPFFVFDQLNFDGRSYPSSRSLERIRESIELRHKIVDVVRECLAFRCGKSNNNFFAHIAFAMHALLFFRTTRHHAASSPMSSVQNYEGH
jgi:hypothetical protein